MTLEEIANNLKEKVDKAKNNKDKEYEKST
jgi:hypothetical protein